MRKSRKTFPQKRKNCRVTIDVAPREYTKSDRYLKMLINTNTFKKGSNRYD